MLKNCIIKAVGVNSDEYHKQTSERGTAGFIVSPSSLKAFSECPSRWKAGYEPPDSEAKEWGSLLDTIWLTPEQFAGRYAVKPSTYVSEKGEEKPWNGNSNVCKEWLADHADKTVVSANDVGEVQKAVRRLMADETIAAFHKVSKKQVHIIGEWHDKATGLVIPVQCLLDFVPGKESEFQKCLGDLKSTRNAGQRPFSRWCYQAGYHIQAAFDLALYTAATGEDRTDWVFILQENYAPYETGRRLLGQDFIDIGRQTYEHALSRYARCVKTGVWGGYDLPEEFSLITPEPYMEFQALSEKLESDAAEAMEESGDVPS
jgi:hypothetical protein